MTDAAFRSAPALAEALRGAARAALPEGAILRLDRGDGLFAACAARGAPGADWAGRLAGAGFAAAPAGRLLRVAPGPRWAQALADAWPEPPDFLCRTLKRFDGPPDGESLALFTLGAKGLFGMPDGDFARRLRQRAAVCLRAGGGGGLYACGLLAYLRSSETEEVIP